MKKEMPLANKIYFLPIYPDVVRAVRYGLVPCSDVVAALKAVIAEHGQQKVDAAARELLDYEQVGKKLCAKLKPSVRVHCRMLIGPLPEEAESFWRNADGSWPQNTPPEVIAAAEKKPRRTKKKAA